MTDTIFHWFGAHYPGACSACGERFNSGDTIAYFEGAYVAKSCCEGSGTIGSIEEFYKAVDICLDCHLTHAPLQIGCE